MLLRPLKGANVLRCFVLGDCEVFSCQTGYNVSSLIGYNDVEHDQAASNCDGRNVRLRRNILRRGRLRACHGCCKNYGNYRKTEDFLCFLQWNEPFMPRRGVAQTMDILTILRHPFRQYFSGERRPAQTCEAIAGGPGA